MYEPYKFRSMKTCNFLFASAILLLVVCSCKNGNTKKLPGFFDNAFTSEEGNFKINFKNKPVHSSETIGDMAISVHTFTDDCKTYETGVIYADYPKGALKGIDANEQKVLSGAKDGALSSLSSSMGSFIIEEQRDIQVKSYPGVLFKARFEKGLCVIYQLVLVKDRLYQIRMTSENNFPDNKISTDFFTSFDILNEQ